MSFGGHWGGGSTRLSCPARSLSVAGGRIFPRVVQAGPAADPLVTVHNALLTAADPVPGLGPVGGTHHVLPGGCGGPPLMLAFGAGDPASTKESREVSIPLLSFIWLVCHSP